MPQLAELRRTSPTQLELVGDRIGVPVRVHANEEVAIDHAAIEELSAFVEVTQTVEKITEHAPSFFADDRCEVLELTITPDFHKGTGVPIGTAFMTRGFIVPQAIGKDVNCGMRLHTTDLNESQVRSQIPKLQERIRTVFFGGQRAIPMNRVQRDALLRQGLVGLCNTSELAQGEGLWRYYDRDQQEAELDHVRAFGCEPADEIPFVQDYLGSEQLTYDDQIGSIGGGNHFVEVQVVEKILDGQTAHAWNLKPGQVVVMVHSGCLTLGYPTGMRAMDLMRDVYPAGLRSPENDVLLLPQSDPFLPQWRKYENAYANAANFASANRLFLAMMLRRTLTEAIGECRFDLLYDTGHNIITREQIDGEDVFLHRKGVTPAAGPEQMAGTPFAYYGEPVLIPGSMGASSFVLAGNGRRENLMSASHGAGRHQSRGKAMKVSDAELDKFLAEFHIVTPMDPTRPDIRSRPELLKKWRDEIKQEAPWAYKDIGPVIETQVESGALRSVAELRPILTVKS